MTEAALLTVATLVARAGTLEERRCGRAVRGDAADAARRLSAWQRIVARDDAGQWARRLRFDHIDLVDAAAIVETENTPADGGGDWVHLAHAVLAAADQPLARGDPALNAGAPVPFEDVLLPFIQVARARLSALAGDAFHSLAAPAHAQLERALMCRLSAAAAPLLYQEFTTQGSAYDRFAHGLRSGGWHTLFERRAALARFLVARTGLWIEATAELLARIEADRDLLRETFSDGASIGRVVAVDPEISDSHNGGRMVALLRFESGVRVAYKPRSLAAESAYARFVAWMNGVGASPQLRALSVIDCGTHGWMERAHPSSCTDADSARRYYRRAGMIASAMYLLGGQDLHSGNVVADGEHPLLFDLEALMQPLLPEEGIGDAAAVGSWRHIHGSVLSTYLLPLLSRGASGATYIEGGFAATDTSRTVTARRWRDVNTDEMALYEEPVVQEVGVNVPRFDGPPTSDEQLTELLAGFQHAYGLFTRHRAALLSPNGPLAPFRDLHVRLLLRSTDVYGALLRRSLRPDAVVTGADRSIALDILRRPFIRGETPHRLWEAVRYEVSELERGDVPVFQIGADDNALIAGDNVVVPEYAESSGFEQTMERVRSLGRVDAERQSSFARIAWTMYELRRTRARPSEPPVAIAEMLRALATRAPGGGARWMTLGDTGFLPTDLSLGNGRIGIALFLAALEYTTGYPTRDLVYAAIDPLLRNSVDRGARAHGIGGARGIGGIVYGLTRIAAWLDEPLALDAAKRLASCLTPQRINADRKLDVFDGAAGAILGLLALHAATGSEVLLNRALSCARHLLRRRERDDATGTRVWRTMNGELTGGFAHGAAGIACALARVRQHADTALAAEIDIAIDDTRAFEASLFVREPGNWVSTPSARRVATEKPPLICGWCHGAAGIGLSRLSLLDVANESSLFDEIETALSAMLPFEEKPAAQDHLCCGNAGRIEFLHLAGLRLGRPDLISRSRAYAEKVVMRARERTTYGAGSVDEGFAPSFLFGLAGIGYELLRLDHSDRLPSLLIWE